jgi:hypothetical protein
MTKVTVYTSTTQFGAALRAARADSGSRMSRWERASGSASSASWSAASRLPVWGRRCRSRQHSVSNCASRIRLTGRTLDVYCFGRPAGTLTDDIH